jgi:hypothetical protein
MAINPFRVGQLELPPSPRPVPLDFSFLSDLGGAIGGYREQQAMAELAAGARDEQGNIDVNKLATAAALRGRTDLARKLLETSFERQRLQQQAEFQRQGLKLREQELEQGKVSSGVTTDLFGNPLGWRMGPKGVETFPLTKQPDLTPPAPGPAAPSPAPGPASAAPGPQGALEPSSFTERFLGGGEQTLGPRVRTAALGDVALPSEAIRPAEPATQTAQAAPAPATPATPTVPAARNQWVLDRFPQQAGQIKAWAEYEEPPPKQIGLHELIRTYRPDWKSSQYEIEQKKREQEIKTPTQSAEMAARLGIASKFQLSLEDRKDEQGNVLPGVRSRIKAGELNRDWQTALMANYYKGGPGEIRQLIDDGAEALIRMLTGAGMNLQEAADYGNRFRFRLIDNQRESLTKVNNLDDVLKSVTQAVRTGKAGPDELRNIVAPRASEFAPERATQPGAPQQQQAPVRVRSLEEARQLPPGTRIILPDGDEGVVPPRGRR